MTHHGRAFAGSAAARAAKGGCVERAISQGGDMAVRVHVAREAAKGGGVERAISQGGDMPRVVGQRGTGSVRTFGSV